LADNVRQVVMYLQKVRKLKGASVAKTDGSIFIGHGGKSIAWRDLKDLLVERMDQAVEEYNSAPTAGYSRTERLSELLGKCTIAFLVMTAEDETADGKSRARQNVIHEIGLFQGRYSWRRAIILLESGCEEFSNIAGLDHIKFPKDGITSVSEEIRKVLEWEGLL
jgi:predicted nucleotide-binding protein